MIIDGNAYLGHFAFRQLRHNTGEGLLRLMDRAGIGRAVLSSASAITYRNPQPGNEEVAARVKAAGTRLIPFAVLNPAYAGWRDDREICREKFGMKGVRLYTAWHRYRLSAPERRELVNAAAEREMVISIPVRAEDRRQQSWLVEVPDLGHDDIAALVRACPNARFVTGNGNGFTRSVPGRPNSGLPANYAIEITWLTAELGNETGALLDSLGADRLLFGSGMPFHYAGPALAKIEILDAPETVKAKICAENAVRWLRL